MTWKDSVKIPIATLKEGVYQSSITGSFISYPPVTFSLVKGSGPVHIVGLHLVGSPIFEEEMDDMEEEMPDDEEGEEGDVSIYYKKKNKTTYISFHTNVQVRIKTTI
nr:unnamed protein product [Callosobruchus analis]CAI5837376.1 unnamed protein product [Callosobruchus analis]CAI5849089.1 unnamed protein product [Callosobruchus analis]CAI5853091.1 unnamed protein product [Callosobruchus analis]CAI5862715.1 unnamed protein product [Callosobruchus analis]